MDVCTYGYEMKMPMVYLLGGADKVKYLLTLLKSSTKISQVE